MSKYAKNRILFVELPFYIAYDLVFGRPGPLNRIHWVIPFRESAGLGDKVGGLYLLSAFLTYFAL